MNKVCFNLSSAEHEYSNRYVGNSLTAAQMLELFKSAGIPVKEVPEPEDQRVLVKWFLDLISKSGADTDVQNESFTITDIDSFLSAVSGISLKELSAGNTLSGRIKDCEKIREALVLNYPTVINNTPYGSLTEAVMSVFDGKTVFYIEDIYTFV